MKSPYVNELAPNQPATGTFLVQSKEVRQKKTGEPYLSLVVADRSGELDAKMWDNVAEVMDTFERDDFVRLKGLVQVYQNRPQLTIHKVTRVDDSDVDFTDFFPASQRNAEEMWSELRALVSELKNPHLKLLLDGLLDDPEIARRYKLAPAAKFIHHAYLSGLLEHVLSLVQLCRLVAARYTNIDGDLLVAGAILHDLGKIHELSYDRSFGYSNEGQLLGHIVIGLRMVDERIATIPGFPPRLRTLVEHMILSHHGELEFGSPKVPMFPEALLLHYLDNLDSKMECMRTAAERDSHIEGCWTGYNHALERTVLKKGKYLEEPAEEPREASRPQPPPVAPRRAPAPKTPSLFGERLQDALGKEP